MNNGTLRPGRSPIDGRPTVPWVRWVLNDYGYVLHVTKSLDRDGPWPLLCGAKHRTEDRVVPLVTRQDIRRVCGNCWSASGRGTTRSITIVAALEGFTVGRHYNGVEDTHCLLEATG